MAVVSLLGSTFNTTSGTHTVVATPAVGDMIVVVLAHTGSTVSGNVSDNNADGLGSAGNYNQAFGGGANKLTDVDRVVFLIRKDLIGSATSTTFSGAPGTTTGGGIAVIKITGITKKGLKTDSVTPAAIRGTANQANQAGGGTPTPVLGSAALTTSAIIGAVLNGANPAGMTPRASPAYTERLDTGYATPTTGIEIMSIDSGETGTSIAWGSTSATAFGAAVIEIDSTVPSAALTGTATASITEADIVDGGKTIILTLTNDVWITAGNGFNTQRQNIINGLDSAQSEANGWDAEVKAKIAVTDVVRTSATVVTITLDAEAAYNITAQETITATIPVTAVDGGLAIVASPTFTITPVTAVTHIWSVKSVNQAVNRANNF